MSEQTEFDEAVSQFKLCEGPSTGGCGCTGNCLQHQLAKIRQKYDTMYDGDEYWFSDQLHGALKKRQGDSGRHGADLNPDNYWTGVS